MLRWLRIVRQACEQCGRSTVPAIRKPLAFRDFITLEEFSGFTRLLCCEKAGTARRMEVKAGPSVICIGPEGGWDQEEIETSIRAGYRPVSLGENILRVETAALAAVILVRSTDWGFLVAD